MALIQKIRKNSWILIIFIALGLFAFLLMDMGGGGPNMSDQFTLGTVNGEIVDNREFQTAEQILYNNQSSSFTAKKDLWEYFLQKSLLSDEAEKLGLGVGETELEGLLYGPDYSPFVRNQFTNPSTGQMDVAGLNNIKQQVEAGTMPTEQEDQWNFISEFAKEERVQAKVLGMLSQGIYAPSWMVEQQYLQQNTKMKIDYVKIPYSEISSGDVSVSDSDIKTYLNQHQGDYLRKEEERVADYVIFEVTPSASDSAALISQMKTIQDQWQASDNDSSTTLLQRGIYNTQYITIDQIDPEISAQMIGAEAGSTFGPYIKNGNYKTVLLTDKMELADSTRARHIMISANPADRNSVIAANAQVDSLMEVLNSGAVRFDTLANRLSQDASSNTKGGDLGYLADVAWSPDINDLIKYRAEQGKIYKTYSRFGVHIVEVTGKKMGDRTMGYRIASVARPIIPSNETQEQVEGQANDFLYENRTIENMRTAAEADNSLRIQTSESLSANDFVFGSLGESNASRKMVKWMFNKKTKLNEAAGELFVYNDPVNYFSKYFIIPALTEKRAPGLPTVAEVKSQIEPILVNRKKAASAKTEITGKDLAAIAGQYGSSVLSQDNIAFGNDILPVIGSEPELLAALSSLDVNGTTVVGGNSAIYYAKLTERQEAIPATNITQLKSLTTRSDRSRMPTAVIEAMRENADIEDKRSIFF